MADRFFSPLFAWVDGQGLPVPGGLLEFYTAGTSTPKATYSDAGLTAPNTNPVALNGDGYAGAIFGSGSYKVVFKRADGSTIWTQDGFTFVPGLPIGIDAGGTGGTTAEQARANLGLGTAAVSDTGTNPGNVVIVQAGGQIDPALIPATAANARGPGALLFLSRNTR